MVVRIKKLLIVVAVLALIMTGGYMYVNNYLFNTNSELDNASTDQQQEIILSNDQYNELPEVKELKEQLEKKTKTDSNAKAISKDNTSSKDNAVSKGNVVSKNTKVNQSAPEDQERIPTKKEIENRLHKKMNNLQAEYNGRINGLLASAKTEYLQIKSGSKKVSMGSLAKKYLNLGKSLEAECDARVYAAIAFTENELAQYNYSSNITEQARKTYKQTKDERRVQLFDRLASYL